MSVSHLTNDEEIQLRKTRTAERRAEQRKVLEAELEKDRKILATLHENRGQYRFFRQGDVTLLVCVNHQEDDNGFTVYDVVWSVRNPDDDYSMRIAKKQIGRYMVESNADHHFQFSARVGLHDDGRALELYAFSSFLGMAATGLLKAPQRIKETARFLILTGFECRQGW